MQQILVAHVRAASESLLVLERAMPDPGQTAGFAARALVSASIGKLVYDSVWTLSSEDNQSLVTGSAVKVKWSLPEPMLPITIKLFHDEDNLSDPADDGMPHGSYDLISTLRLPRFLQAVTLVHGESNLDDEGKIPCDAVSFQGKEEPLGEWRESAQKGPGFLFLVAALVAGRISLCLWSSPAHSLEFRLRNNTQLLDEALDLLLYAAAELQGGEDWERTDETDKKNRGLFAFLLVSFVESVKDGKIFVKREEYTDEENISVHTTVCTPNTDELTGADIGGAALCIYENKRKYKARRTQEILAAAEQAPPRPDTR